MSFDVQQITYGSGYLNAGIILNTDQEGNMIVTHQDILGDNGMWIGGNQKYLFTNPDANDPHSYEIIRSGNEFTVKWKDSANSSWQPFDEYTYQNTIPDELSFGLIAWWDVESTGKYKYSNFIVSGNQINPVSEPSTMLLLGSGLLGL